MQVKLGEIDTLDEQSLIFRCFASGSSGNCYYLGTSSRGILIDAGISARSIQRGLIEMGLNWSNIMGVLVTHDHADHIRAVDTIGERVHVPIYSTREIHEGIDANYGVKEKLRGSRRYFVKEQPWELFGMKINTFSISHDSTDCLGYVIDYLGQRFLIATDCGEPNEQLRAYLKTANHIVIEANHDEQKLLNGAYPTYLKQRILSPFGHMSNHTCGELLQENYHPGMRNIFLCHLSRENNDPQIAFETVCSYLEEIGLTLGEDFFLCTLDRTTPSPIYVLNDQVLPVEKTPYEEEGDNREEDDDE